MVICVGIRQMRLKSGPIWEGIVMGTIFGYRPLELGTLSRWLRFALVARPILSSPSVRTTALLARWYDRILQRHHLAAMDERMLRDIGLHRSEVRREAAKTAVSRKWWKFEDGVISG